MIKPIDKIPAKPIKAQTRRQRAVSLMQEFLEADCRCAEIDFTDEEIFKSANVQARTEMLRLAARTIQMQRDVCITVTMQRDKEKYPHWYVTRSDSEDDGK